MTQYIPGRLFVPPLARKICRLLPSTSCYVEPAGSDMSVLMVRSPSKSEVYNDKSYFAAKFAMVLRSQRLMDEFYRACVYSVPFDDTAIGQDVANADIQDSLRDLATWYVHTRRYVYNGSGDFVVKYPNVRSFVQERLQYLDRLPEIAMRLLTVHICHSEPDVVIRDHDSRNTLFYYDAVNTDPAVDTARTISALTTAAGASAVLTVSGGGESCDILRRNRYYSTVVSEEVDLWRSPGCRRLLLSQRKRKPGSTHDRDRQNTSAVSVSIVRTPRKRR